MNIIKAKVTEIEVYEIEIAIDDDELKAMSISEIESMFQEAEFYSEDKISYDVEVDDIRINKE